MCTTRACTAAVATHLFLTACRQRVRAAAAYLRRCATAADRCAQSSTKSAAKEWTLDWRWSLDPAQPVGGACGGVASCPDEHWWLHVGDAIVVRRSDQQEVLPRPEMPRSLSLQEVTREGSHRLFETRAQRRLRVIAGLMGGHRLSQGAKVGDYLMDCVDELQEDAAKAAGIPLQPWRRRVPLPPTPDSAAGTPPPAGEATPPPAGEARVVAKMLRLFLRSFCARVRCRVRAVFMLSLFDATYIYCPELQFSAPTCDIAHAQTRASRRCFIPATFIC